MRSEAPQISVPDIFPQWSPSIHKEEEKNGNLGVQTIQARWGHMFNVASMTSIVADVLAYMQEQGTTLIEGRQVHTYTHNKARKTIARYFTPEGYKILVQGAIVFYSAKKTLTAAHTKRAEKLTEHLKTLP